MVCFLAFLSVAVLGLINGLDRCETGRDDCNATVGALDAQFLLQSKVKVSGSELNNTAQFPQCAPGTRGGGGTCDCLQAESWNASWKDAWCYEGKCYSGIEDDRCIGNPDGKVRQLGDDTWCYGERRNTECAVEGGGGGLRCPRGTRGGGGTCDCSRARGWNDTWKDPWCHEGKCYSGIEDHRCIGNPDGEARPLGDGTWCYGERRDTECPAIGGGDDKCKEKCSVIPEGAIDSACFTLFRKTCEAQFQPENYMGAGKERMDRDIELVGTKVLEMNPSLSVDEVRACEQCHTEGDDDDRVIPVSGGVSGGDDDDEDEVDRCKDECSALPAGADDDACLALWDMSCHEKFDPGKYLASGLPKEKMMEKIRDDSKAVAAYIKQMNPAIPATEVDKCEQCHTADADDVERCKDECSALPHGAEIGACLALWNKTCDDHFHPRKYVEAGMSQEKILEKFFNDSKLVAHKIIEANPFINASEVEKCEQCHTKGISDDLVLTQENEPEHCIEECKEIPDGADEEACRTKFNISCDEHFNAILISDDIEGGMVKMINDIAGTIASLYPQIPAESMRQCEMCRVESLPPLSVLSLPKVV